MKEKILDSDEMVDLKREIEKMWVVQGPDEEVEDFMERAHDLTEDILKSFGVEKMFFTYAECAENLPFSLAPESIIIMGIVLELDKGKRGANGKCTALFGLFGWNARIGHGDLSFVSFADPERIEEYAEIEVIPLEEGEDYDFLKEWAEIECTSPWPVVYDQDNDIETFTTGLHRTVNIC